MPDARFRKAEHLRKPEQYQAIYDRRRSVSDAAVIVYGALNGLPHNRLGLSVSRKVGGAVVRNRVKRRLRELFRLTKANVPVGMDLIVIPRSPNLPALAELIEHVPALLVALHRRLTREAGP